MHEKLMKMKDVIRGYEEGLMMESEAFNHCLDIMYEELVQRSQKDQEQQKQE